MKQVSIVLFACLLLDPAVAGAYRKAAEKKSYAFTVETKFEGEQLPGSRGLEQPVNGVWEKGETMTAKVGRDGAQMVRKVARAVYKIGDDQWQTADEIRKAAQAAANQQGGRNQTAAVLARLEAVVSGHAEWLKAMSKAGGLAKQKEEESGCVAWIGTMGKDAAKDAIEEVLDAVGNGGGGNPVGRNGQVQGGGGGGGYNRGGGNEIRVKEATGTIKFLVSKDEELPHSVVMTVTAKIVRQQDGKPSESETKMTRTVTFSDWEKAKAEIPDEAAKRLK
jgi:hypothetical protein